LYLGAKFAPGIRFIAHPRRQGVAIAQQTQGERPANETGGAGNEYVHGDPPV
jgi:hypothetical protein